MTTMLSVTELRAHLETDLPDATLHRINEAAKSLIVERYGAHDAQTDLLEGGERYVFPTRPISAVTSVKEYVGDTETVLASDDYRLWHGGRMVERLSTGTNAGDDWPDRVEIVYTPVSRLDQRRMAQVELARLWVVSNGLASERTGDYQATSKDMADAQENILRSIAEMDRLPL